MDPTLLAILAVAFLAAGTVKGGIGIGLPTVAIAVLGSALDMQAAVPLLVVPAVAANLWQTVRGGEVRPMLRRFWLMAACAGIGIWLGTRLLYASQSTAYSALLGVVVCAYAVVNLTAFRLRLPPRWEPVASPAVGLISGLLTGSIGSAMLPVILYLQALGLDKDAFVKASGVLLLVMSSLWAAALVEAGALDGPTALASTLALVPTAAGLAIGQWCRDRVSQEAFRRAVFLVLFALGINLIRKGLF